MMENSKVTVKGMSCGGCKGAVERAVKALPGIETAAVDLKAEQLTVSYDNAKTSLADIKKAVVDAGYEVE